MGATYFSGKGVNVTRALGLASGITRTVVPIGAEDALPADASESDHGVIVTVTVPGATRRNTIVVNGAGSTTNINAQPNPVSAENWRRLGDATLECIRDIAATWLVIAGSLPRDIETGRLFDLRGLIRAAQDAGVRIGLDMSGSQLEHVVNSEVTIDLVKPNRDELSDLVGRALVTVGDVYDAAQELRTRGVESVLTSLGSDGILLVDGGGALWAQAPLTVVVNTTGAGDASLAGYLSAIDRDPENSVEECRRAALRRAVEWGTLAVQQPTTILPEIREVPGVRLVEFDPSHLLSAQ